MKKIFLLATTLVVLCSFSSCNKDNFADQNVTTNHISPSKEAVEDFTIAILKEGDLVPLLLFDKDDFTSIFQENLLSLYGDLYVFDDISIWDEDPYDMEREPSLRISMLETNTGKTISLYMLIEKKSDDLGSTIQYILKKKKKKMTVVKCIGNCKKGGCYINKNNTGCEPCKDSNGQCESDVQTIYIEENNGGGSNPWLHTIIGVVATILVALLCA